MSLSVKALLLVIFIVIPSVFATYLSSRLIILKGFERLETEKSERNVRRVLNVIESSVDNLHLLNRDWANWNDSYEFAQGKNSKFVETNFTDETLFNAKLNLIAFYDLEGNLIHAKAFDLKNQTEIDIPDNLSKHLVMGKLLLGEGESDKHGVMSTEDGGLLFVSAHPILTSSSTGPSVGTIIMARTVDEEVVTSIGSSAELPVNIVTAGGQVTGDKSISLKIVDDKKVLGYGKIIDVYGSPSLVAEVEMDREITREGIQTVNYFIYFLVGVGLLGVVVSNIFLRAIVLKPVENISRDVAGIASVGDFTQRVGVKGGGELASLAKGVNQMLSALETAQGRLKVLMSNLAGMAYRCMNDEKWTMEFVSEGAVGLTGYQPVELIANRRIAYADVIVPEDRKKVWDEVQKSVKVDLPYQLNYRILTKDGVQKWVWEQGRAVNGPEGIRLEGFITDVSAQKKAEEALAVEKANVEKKVEQRTAELAAAKEKVSQGWFAIQQEKAKLVSSINSLALGFVITDGAGNIILTNPAVNKVLGEEQKWTLDSLQAVLGSQYSLREEIDLCLKDPTKCFPKTVEVGSKFVRVLLCPITSLETTKKETYGVVVIFEDTTQAKLLERSRDEFFSIASHELRTPLTAIRGNASLLMDQYGGVINKNTDMKEMIDDMHASSIRLIKIVSDFLDSSRLEQNKIEFKKEQLDLGSVVEGVVRGLEPLANAKKIYLKFNKPEGVVSVVGDNEKITQIVTNIVGNAVNYTKEGGVALEIVADGQNASVRVADTGVGISPTNQSLLFKKFQQAGERVLARDLTQGTGMGLYISKLLAKGMGGDVSLEKSELGKGSTFVFTLPAVVVG